MPTELEEELRRSLGGAALRFPPPPDLRGRVEARLASHRRRRRAGVLAAVAGLVGVAVTGFGLASPGGRGEAPVGDRVVAGPPASELADPWVEAEDPVLGFHFEHPAAWTVQHYAGQCKVGATGTLVTNLDRTLQFEQEPPINCSTGWDLDGVPAGFAAVEISRYLSAFYGRTSVPDTAFPLSLDRAIAVDPAGDGTSTPTYQIQVTLAGEVGYLVKVWVGREVTPEDRERLGRLVASIRPPAVGEGPRSGPPAFTPCPEGLSEPTLVERRLCAPEAPPGNGSGLDGACTGEETVPPCGPGAEVGRYYPYTLPLRCDGLAIFDGRRWISMLPPPRDGGTMRVWMRLDESGGAGFVSVAGSVGFLPDTGDPPKPCRG